VLPRIANGSGKQYGQGGNRILQLWVRSLCSRSLHDRELMTCSAKAGTIQEKLLWKPSPTGSIWFTLGGDSVSRFIQKSIISGSRFLWPSCSQMILRK